jgi:hypothetical protein
MMLVECQQSGALVTPSDSAPRCTFCAAANQKELQIQAYWITSIFYDIDA